MPKVSAPADQAARAGASASAVVPAPEDMLARAQGLIPALRGRAEETERLRRMPDSTMAELRAAEMFHLLSPKAVGGFGMGVETYGEVVRRLARVGPVGWAPARAVSAARHQFRGA